MIVRGGAGNARAVGRFLGRNWRVVALVLAIQGVAWALHEAFPDAGVTGLSAAAVGLLATVVGIFLAFRFNEAYSRWWEARTLWGGMVNASRTFGRQAVTLLTPERVPGLGPEEARAVQRELIYRHLAYVNALRLSLRRQPVWPEIEPYLDAGEAEALRTAANVPVQLLRRQASRLCGLLGREASEQILLAHLDATLSRMTDLQGGMERIKNTAFPDRVVVASRVLVWIVGLLVAFAFIEPERQIFVFESLAVPAIILAFLAVKQLGEELNNPFEDCANDTPMTALCRTIEIDLRQQLGETNVPPPLEPVGGVLM